MSTTHVPKTSYRVLTLAVIATLTLSASNAVFAAEQAGTLFVKKNTFSRNQDCRIKTPPVPQGSGLTDSALVADESTTPPLVDYYYTNQRGDARYATKETNAGVRVVSGFLDLWTPSTLIVDSGVSAAANGSFPAVVKSTWSGIPGDATDGTIVNASVHDANIQYVINATATRTDEQATLAYLDDRRSKGYSMTDGLGPLTEAWRTLTQQTTTINDVAADATTVKYDDNGNNRGVGVSGGNTTFGTVVDFLGTPPHASTEPAKRFYKYARPWRWSNDVSVLPTLEPAKSTSPSTDGGFVSGHMAEAMRNALGMAYVVPERFQALLARGAEMGDSRILAGMHSPLDVIGGRIQGHAFVAAGLYALQQQSMKDNNGVVSAITDTRKAAYLQAHSALMAAVGVSDLTAFNAFAHSDSIADDRFADHATNKAYYRNRLTYGFSQIGDTTKPAVVPKGAELLIETRLPYLSAAQRRVVLKTTALPSGYPALDDAEGWGRLNLFDAADGYGAFNGDVVVTMDASNGGFSAMDSWQNNISGVGKLTKQGSGTLKMTGTNSYTGGTQVMAGVLQAESSKAFGKGDVYLSGGAVVNNAPSGLVIAGTYTQLANTSLKLNVGDNGAGSMKVGGDVTVVGGTLNIAFKSGYTPSAGSTLPIIQSRHMHGKFTTVTADGFNVKPIYTHHGLLIHIEKDNKHWH